MISYLKKKQNLGSVNNQKDELNSIKFSNNFNLVFDEAILEMNKDTYDGVKKAINLLEPYSETMNGDNLSILGYCFEKIKDYLPAMKYYKMAGEKGNDWGNYAVARFYING